MSRPDQSITFLRQYGYSVFRYPRASAQPLEVMHRDGKDLSRLGTLPQLISIGAQPLPAIARDEAPGIDIDGTETSKVNVAIGVNILGAFIGALGGGNLGLAVGFKKARTVTFRYAGVMEDRVDVLALESCINAGQVLASLPPGTIDKLIDDEVYVVTSVLKTRSIIVSAQGEAGNSVELDVPVIKGTVGGSVKTEFEGAVSSSVRFEGDVPVAFGLQAVQLVFDDALRLATTKSLPPGGAGARTVRPGDMPGGRRPAYLETRGAFVRVGE